MGRGSSHPTDMKVLKHLPSNVERVEIPLVTRSNGLVPDVRPQGVHNPSRGALCLVYVSHVISHEALKQQGHVEERYQTYG